MVSPTPVLGELAKEGIVLETHCALAMSPALAPTSLPLTRRPARPDVYKYCSPTRRSFLSGRFPTHINPGGNGQAPICSDYLPLRTTLLSEKLKSAGFGTHFIGKGHLCAALPPSPARAPARPRHLLKF